ncbi:MAG: hypothetical protein MK179_10420 [Pirellulaceae bacterium]|nr:hypothetical protein [Pirellulaceae bacterium]
MTSDLRVHDADDPNQQATADGGGEWERRGCCAGPFGDGTFACQLGIK